MHDRQSAPRTKNPDNPRTTRAALAFYGLISAALSWFLADDLGLLELLPFLRHKSFVIFLMLALGALIGITRARILVHAGAVATLCFWLIVAYSPLAAHLAQPLKIEAAPVPADAIVVLGSSIQRDNDLSAAALARLVRGLELVQGKFAPRLVLTEIGPPHGVHKIAAATLMAHLKIRCPIETVGFTRNTHDEAVLVSGLARQRGWKKILLVTSSTHSRRALLTFRKTGLEVVSTPCREGDFDLENLRGPGDRIDAFEAAIREVVGLRVYRARGWI
ncbi:MAG: YdcF family protein [Armatimonadota bacterium]|nr:YdcF family protein [Armatimonadota bacterium]